MSLVLGAFTRGLILALLSLGMLISFRMIRFTDITVDGSITLGASITALMVTHSMQQAVDLPDRIIMMHRGQIVEDYRADMKRRVRIPDLIAAFDRVQKRELIDESVANLLAEQYC